MRLYYGLAAAFLSILALFLGVWNIRYSPSPPEKALSRTPKGSETSYPEAKASDRAASLPDIKAVWDRNLFDPARGAAEKMEEGVAAAKRADLELIGICKFGEVSGAIIVNKSSSPAQGAAPGQQPGQPGASKGKGEKRYYNIGQRMSNGFVLKEVYGDHVILARGNEEMVLKLQFGDDSSNKRIASVGIKPEPPKEEPPPATTPDGQAQPEPGKSDDKRPKGLPKPPAPPPMRMKNIMT